jgi:hypothetical protein
MTLAHWIQLCLNLLHLWFSQEQIKLVCALSCFEWISLCDSIVLKIHEFKSRHMSHKMCREYCVGGRSWGTFLAGEKKGETRSLLGGGDV